VLVLVREPARAHIREENNSERQKDETRKNKHTNTKRSQKRKGTLTGLSAAGPTVGAPAGRGGGGWLVTLTAACFCRKAHSTDSDTHTQTHKMHRW
jgi:hypothetical protein